MSRPSEQLLDADQVAQRLQVSRRHVLELRRLDPCPIPAINVSASSRPNYRWRPSVVEAFLRNRKAVR